MFFFGQGDGAGTYNEKEDESVHVDPFQQRRYFSRGARGKRVSLDEVVPEEKRRVECRSPDGVGCIGLFLGDLVQMDERS